MHVGRGLFFLDVVIFYSFVGFLCFFSLNVWSDDHNLMVRTKNSLTGM